MLNKESINDWDIEKENTMDLGAFVQIGNLEQIMTSCDIHVPRLRGLRLMKNEVPLSSEEINLPSVRREKPRLVHGR